MIYPHCPYKEPLGEDCASCILWLACFLRKEPIPFLQKIELVLKVK